jgi:hypothetical protein
MEKVPAPGWRSGYLGWLPVYLWKRGCLALLFPGEVAHFNLQGLDGYVALPSKLGNLPLLPSHQSQKFPRLKGPISPGVSM